MRARPAVLIAMPTRAEKNAASTAWRICVDRSVPAASFQKKMQMAVEKRQVHLEFRVIACILVELRWPRAVKYDVVQKFVKQAIPYEFDIRPAALEEQEAADAAVSAAALADVEGHAPSASSTAGDVVASGADSATDKAARALPQHLLPLKLQDASGLGAEYVFKNTFDVSWDQPLGQGTYGQVYRGKQTMATSDAAVAIKTFPHTTQGGQDAAYEVSVYAALPHHPHVSRLLDVGVTKGRLCLVSDLHDGDLAAVIKAGPLHEAQQHHILRCCCLGVSHLHGQGLCHNDLKPANVLVSGARQWAAETSDEELAARLLQLPSHMRVVLADLGNAVLADPEHRSLERVKRIKAKGIQQGTMYYRSPEVLLGMASYSSPTDIWALGCLAAELLIRKPLFKGARETEMQQLIFRMFGTPKTGTLVGLPLSQGCFSQCPLITAPSWPPASLTRGLRQPPSAAFLDFLQAALRLEPDERFTAADAVQHNIFKPPTMAVLWKAVPAGRGAGSLVQGTLAADLLAWLQADPVWASLAEQCARSNFRPDDSAGRCMPKKELDQRNKYERVGHVLEDASGISPVLCSMSADTPCCSTRIRRFAQEFLRCNKAWLLQLTSKVRYALQALPASVLCQNGEDFMKNCFADKAFAYATVQVMRSSDRRDPKHFDGGASLLHMGLTVFGRRFVECWMKCGTSVQFEQVPGSVYVSNMCAIEHQVCHCTPNADQQLGPEGFEITVMFRSDVFRNTRARMSKCKLSPTDVFDIVNRIVAAQLGEHPMMLPAFARCAGLECAASSVCASAAASASVPATGAPSAAPASAPAAASASESAARTTHGKRPRCEQ